MRTETKQSSFKKRPAVKRPRVHRTFTHQQRQIGFSVLIAVIGIIALIGLVLVR